MKVVEQPIEVRTHDGTADGVLFKAADGGQRPGVLYLTDIGGVREANLGMARRVAEQGYTVLVPNIFYRTSKVPVFSFKITFGEERTAKRFAELSAPLTPEATERDAASYVDFLAANSSVTAAPIGVVGFCYSGAMAMRTAMIRPQQVAAAASFHGGRLCTDQPSSPHLLLPGIKARLYFAHAVNDRSMPAESIAKFEAALRAWGGGFESETYDGALHGWTVPDSPAYNHAQAERAFQKLTELFSGTFDRN
jgi:carboxymethylenebutenolidase